MDISDDPHNGTQGLLTKWNPVSHAGYGLFIDEKACLSLWIGDGRADHRFSNALPLRAAQWYFIAASYDGKSTAHLIQQPQSIWTRADSDAESTHRVSANPAKNDAPVIIAACASPDSTPFYYYNGKIESPAIYDTPLEDKELHQLRNHGTAALNRKPVAAWDFTRDFGTDLATEVSSNALHGRVVNMPARAMTGHAWNGEEINFNHAPDQYGAIYFHDDDLEDVSWETDFELVIPADLKSGVYAFHLRTADADEDYVPFLVRPPKGQAHAPVALLLPTASYLAYGNENFRPSDTDLAPNQHPDISKDRYDYARQHQLRCCYDKHNDGSGVCYASRLRPIVDLRPDHRHGSIACPHGLSADLYLVDWCEKKEIDYDNLSDEILHLEGVSLLKPYKVIVTGSHPEYWSAEMLDAVEAYLADGGRFMYLGGNGLYWVTSFADGKPHLIEVRRAEGVRAWEAAPGELYHSTTGQKGGIWRSRGRAPQKITGVGFTAQGFDFCRPYRRTEESRDPRATFIFEGIADDELIGDFPSLVLHHGAAGFEIDRLDFALGTPPHALLVASSFGHTNAYQHTIEEVRGSNSKQGGRVEPRVRADMVFFEGPNDGAVFSTGSIAWCGGLSYNNYDNTVSRITENVVRRFISDKPFD